MIFPLTRAAIRGIRKETEHPTWRTQIMGRFLRMRETQRTVRIISLHQPYATAMALGLKLNETRHWSTDYRGPIAIHAATTREYIRDWQTADYDHSSAMGRIWQRIKLLFAESGIVKTIDFPLGKILGVTELYDCVSTDGYEPNNEIEKALGGYDKGRFAWRTRNFQRLKAPIPERGRQRWWKWAVPVDSGINLEKFQLV